MPDAAEAPGDLAGRPVTYIDDAIAAVEAEPELAGLEPELTRSYALLALAKGVRVTLQDVHDAWAIHAPPDHPCVIPADQLPREELVKDRPAAEGIRRAAARLHQPSDTAVRFRTAYEQGHSIGRIAGDNDMSYGEVRLLLLEAGTQMRRRGWRLPSTRARKAAPAEAPVLDVPALAPQQHLTGPVRDLIAKRLRAAYDEGHGIKGLAAALQDRGYNYGRVRSLLLDTGPLRPPLGG